MAQIARVAGISKALLYHYFPSKEEYFKATLAEAAAELAGRTAQAADGEEATAEAEERRGGFCRRLRESMSKTREAVGAEIQVTVFGPLNDETWEHLEETLIYADVGAQTTAKIVGRLETEAASGDLAGGEQLQARLCELLAEAAATGEPTIDLRHQPAVVLVVGVNGTG